MTKTHNPANERVKREYFIFLREAKRYSDSSVDGVAKAISRFEAYTKFRDFKAFHRQQAIAFKRNLESARAERTGEALSKATVYSTLAALKAFFIWLAGRPGFKSRIAYADAEYFNLSDNDTRVAKAQREQYAPTLEQMRHAISLMGTATLIERRNRAVVALLLLTGARDGAIASLKLKHVDLADGVLHQPGAEVNTKRRKTFSTWFFPVGDDILHILANWVRTLREEMGWGPEDPLFPSTRVAVGATGHFEAVGLERRPWSNATAIRAILRDALAKAGVPACPPHRIRMTLVVLGERLCRTPEHFKAWSQNLGHEQVMTTLLSYGEVAPRRQAELIRDLAKPIPSAGDPGPEVIAIARRLQAAGLTSATIPFSNRDD